MAAVTPAANTANARVGRGDLDALAAATSPLTLAAEQLLPVDAAASALLPGGVLRRGMAVTIGGRARRSLALTLAAEASSAGSWVALVGVRDMGLAAVEEYGLSLTRLAVIEDPGPDWGAVVAALIGSVDVIITSTPERVSSRDGRRLAARLRERGSVVIELRSQRETVLQGDVTLHADSASWQGLHRGHGRLERRKVVVHTGGRGAAARGGRVEMWLPSAAGRAEVIAASGGPGADGEVVTYDTVADVADLTARLKARVEARVAASE